MTKLIGNNLAFKIAGRMLGKSETNLKYIEKHMEEKFITKDSGKREEYPTGAKRDTQEGKTRYDLIPITALTRLADLYARGAVKYDEFNWSKGICYSRVYSSLLRHLFQWARGEKDEDHLAAVAFGIFSLLHYDETNRTDLDDMEKYRK